MAGSLPLPKEHPRCSSPSRPRHAANPSTLLAASLAACALPAAAQASIVEQDATNGGLAFRANQETNTVTVRDILGAGLEVVDERGLTSRTSLCTSVSGTTLRCAKPSRMSVLLGDRSDRATIATGKAYQRPDGTWVVVKQVTAVDARTGAEVELTGNVKAGATVAEQTVGPAAKGKDATAWTQRLPYTFGEIEKIAALLREMQAMKAKDY